MAVDEIYPIQVVCGFRNEADQNKAFATKTSQLKFPDSKHNQSPSLAVDCVPDPDRNSKTIDWKDIDEFNKMCDAFEETSRQTGVSIRLGRDFKFKDFPHIELS